MILILMGVENIVGKGENAAKPFFQGPEKLGLFGERWTLYQTTKFGSVQNSKHLQTTK